MKTTLFLALAVLFSINIISAANIGTEVGMNPLVISGEPIALPNISVSPVILDFGTVEGTNKTVYLETEFVVKNLVSEEDGTVLDMFISGTDFYDSSSSGGRCPDTNQFTLSHLKYFASNGEYSTLDDPRADEEGYISIQYGLPVDYTDFIQPIFEDQYGNILRPQGEMILKFKLEVPKTCTGEWNSGGIYVIGRNIENPEEETYSYLPLHALINPDVSIELISNITILDTDGNVRDSRITSLREGEKIVFDVQINTGATYEDVYVTIGDNYRYIAQNDVVASCVLINEVGVGIRNYHCVFTVDSPEWMYGEYIFGVATMINRVNDVAYDSIYFKNYFFNMDFILPENITVYENEKVTITPVTEFPDATYSIDNPRFIWNDSLQSLVWQTNDTDSGDYTFTVTAEYFYEEGSHFIDKKQVNVHVIGNSYKPNSRRLGTYLCLEQISDNSTFIIIYL